MEERAAEERERMREGCEKERESVYACVSEERDDRAMKRRRRRRRGERPCTVRGDRWHIIYITLT